MFQRFFYGRYGQDHLGRFLLAIAVVLYIAMLFVGYGTAARSVLQGVALVIVLIVLLRMLSRNTQAEGTKMMCI